MKNFVRCKEDFEVGVEFNRKSIKITLCGSYKSKVITDIETGRKTLHKLKGTRRTEAGNLVMRKLK